MYKLSIILPIYNVEKYIKACLDSIFNQDVGISSFEVIIVNDGTPDGSMKIVSEFLNKYKNITIVSQKNQGLSVARNTGLELARGEYVWFVDSDDCLSVGAINQLLPLIENGHLDVIANNIIRVSEFDNSEKLEKTSIDNKNDNCIVSGVQFLNNTNHIAPAQRFIFKHSFIKKHRLRFMPDVYHEDVDFCCRAIILADSVYCSSIYSYRYLVREEGSIMSAFRIKRSYDLISIAENLSIFKKQQNVTGYAEFALNKYICFCIRSSILMAKGNTQSEEFKLFLSENKSFFKYYFRYSFSTPFLLNIKDLIRGVVMFINPKLILKYNRYL